MKNITVDLTGDVTLNYARAKALSQMLDYGGKNVAAACKDKGCLPARADEESLVAALDWLRTECNAVVNAANVAVKALNER